MKRSWILILLAAFVGAFVLGLALADVKDATEAHSSYETASSVNYGYATPSLGSMGADTAEIGLRIKDVPYLDLATGPTWRLLLGVLTSVPGYGDTVKVEMWHGRDESGGALYRSLPFDSGLVVSGTPEIFDITNTSLSSFPWLQIYIKNDDSTAASYDVDVTLLKGR
jgi:hypothetical protein